MRVCTFTGDRCHKSTVAAENVFVAARTGVSFVAARTGLSFVAARTGVSFVAARTGVSFVAARTGVSFVTARPGFSFVAARLILSLQGYLRLSSSSLSICKSSWRCKVHAL